MLRRADYVTALGEKAIASRRYFSVFARRNALGRSRLGVVVGKKVAARAVDRNRLKRLVREAYRQDRERFGGNDLVVVARRCPAPGGWQRARAELTELLAQIERQSVPLQAE